MCQKLGNHIGLSKRLYCFRVQHQIRRLVKRNWWSEQLVICLEISPCQSEGGIFRSLKFAVWPTDFPIFISLEKHPCQPRMGTLEAYLQKVTVLVAFWPLKQMIPTVWYLSQLKCRRKHQGSIYTIPCAGSRQATGGKAAGKVNKTEISKN